MRCDCYIKLWFLVVSFVVGCHLCVCAEGGDERKKHEFGITPFRIEANWATHNAPFVPKGIFGAYYQRDLGSSNFSWYSALEYGLNRVSDHCKSCVDHTSGTGFLTELNLLSGVRFFPFKKKISRVRPFIQSNVHAALIRYEGTFQEAGRIDQSGLRDVYGLSAGLGVVIRMYSTFDLCLSTSARYSVGTFRGRYLASPSIVVSDEALAPLQIGIGYRF